MSNHSVLSTAQTTDAYRRLPQILVFIITRQLMQKSTKHIAFVVKLNTTVILFCCHLYIVSELISVIMTF